MANQELVSKIAHLRNVSNQFLDFQGRETNVPFENIERIVSAMGYDLNNDDQLAQDAWELDTHQWFKLLEPVTVLSPHRDYWGVSVYVSDHDLHQLLEWSITTESGQVLSGRVELSSLTQTGDYRMPDGIQYVRRLLNLPNDLPLGYHQLSVVVGDKNAESPLVVTPKTSFHNDAMCQGDKVWGSAIQLYTLRSERNWGMGDFTDLAELIRHLADQGAGFVGLNPIHALYPISPDHCSPYSPSNRSFLNVLYVDVESVPEFQESAALKRKVTTEAFSAKVSHLRSVGYVEYSGVSALKFECFKVLYSVFKKKHLGKGTKRDKAFQSFVEEQGEPLKLQALFDALLTHFKEQDINAWGWPAWPEAYQDYRSDAVARFAQENRDEVNYWMYLQFIADEQLQQVAKLSDDLGMKVGLYRDLAVGADRGGAEVWSNSEAFCLDASVGAPPDALGPNGQNWGLPPMDPVEMKREGYQTFITLLRNNMRACNALRIDHALGLLRLWWCPPGKGAAYGAYIYNDLFDLLGILALESQRNECMVIAEDLGTVPEEVRTYFPKVELYSNKIFYFEIDHTGCLPPQDYAPKALAVVCNHDIPTVKAYWTASDLDLRWQLNMFGSKQDFDNEKAAREWAKGQILNALDQQGLLPKGYSVEQAVSESGMSFELSQAIHQYLASSRSQMVGVQLDDMLLIEEPVNVPGTSSEYPNWRRKLTENTDSLFARKGVRQLCTRLNKARKA
jgi:4-alpha-glucanotransferase